MRVISGSVGGRTLVAPHGDGTRPTSDRVREAVFSTLDSWDVIADAAVVDVYAGSGSLGIEALSRGAASARFVDHHRDAVTVIRRNLADLGLPGQVTQAKAQTAFEGAATTHYDLVFIDPPYHDAPAAARTVLEALADGGWLARDPVVVVETSRRSGPFEPPPPFEVLRHKTYGETAVHFVGYP